MDGETLLTTTRAVRRRLDLSRPVPRGLITDCLRIGVQAPIARNDSILRWLFVDDIGKRQGIADVCRNVIAGNRVERGALDDKAAKMYASVDHLYEILHDVPVMAIPYTLEGPPPAEDEAKTRSFWLSTAPQIWNFQLALRLRGLGSVLTTVHSRALAETYAVLDVPTSWYLIALLPIAYTIGTEFKPGARPSPEELVSWNGVTG